jgi:hypothetical protein
MLPVVRQVLDEVGLIINGKGTDILIRVLRGESLEPEKW